MVRKTKHDFSERDWSKKTTCSVKCRGSWVARIRRLKWKFKKCLYCKKDIQTRISRLKFCGDSCMRKYRVGENSPAWKGGRKKQGMYIQVLIGKQHPFSDFHGYIMEHRFIFEEYAKKNNLTKYLVNVAGQLYLNPRVKIHHKNHNKTDNKISNLAPMFSQKEHFHFNYCPHCSHCNKSGELRENPGQDNPQPSERLTTLEGSTTR